MSQEAHNNQFVFTSESVSEGHPDKICDQISDAIVDTYLSADPQARVAVETMSSTNRIILAGEVRAPESVTPDILEGVVRDVVKDIGYAQDTFGWETLEVENYIHQQSPDIAQGVDAGSDKEEGAGDQGIMFGYACDQTDVFMPAPIYYSHKIVKALADVRKSGKQPLLGPDAKSQVTLAYSKDRQPISATNLVVSTQHDASLSQADVREIVKPIVQQVMPEGWMPADENLYVNPTGVFIIGGPHGDAGLTGRKIIVDTYGGAAAHGGGAFSGKDPTKVDRSAAYMARYLAKNIVAAGLARECTIQLSYAIGVSYPLSIYIGSRSTLKVDKTELINVLRDLVDLSPAGIRKHLNLNRPIYRRTAAYGHFGRDPEADGGFSWEKLDLVEPLKKHFSNGDDLKSVA